MLCHIVNCRVKAELIKASLFFRWWATDYQHRHQPVPPLLCRGILQQASNDNVDKQGDHHDHVTEWWRHHRTVALVCIAVTHFNLRYRMAAETKTVSVRHVHARTRHPRIWTNAHKVASNNVIVYPMHWIVISFFRLSVCLWTDRFSND